jgi:hypothetical protein
MPPSPETDSPGRRVLFTVGCLSLFYAALGLADMVPESVRHAAVYVVAMAGLAVASGTTFLYLAEETEAGDV